MGPEPGKMGQREQVLAAENVRLTTELRRTRIALAKAMVALGEISEEAQGTSSERPILPGIFKRANAALTAINPF